MSSPSDRLKNLALNPSSSAINPESTNFATEPPVVMANERSKASFNIRDLTYYLDGGEENTKNIEDIMTSIERDPLFNNDDYYDLTKDQLRELTVQRVASLASHVAKSPQILHKRFALTAIADPGSGTRTGVHYGLFLGSVRGSGTPEQFSYWVNKGAISLKRFFGCFGMTELGHGSNVAGLETTATFDEESDEFIIHTPNLAATKWWIGGAAHTATHTVCFARLIIKGKDYGVKSFVVPLRNTDDWSLKPGVAIGDIGKKMGRDGIDNGWIQFTNVRIPRQFMLMRFSKVDREGNVTEPPLAQLAYGALITGRVSMASDSFYAASRFLTIAIRYAAVRRQFSTNPGEKENVILDYPLHQRRLLPRLAYTYAMNAAAAQLYEQYETASSQLETVDTSDKKALAAAVNDIKELFATSAGVKSFCTWAASDIIDECRQACGGHGYSGYNGFGQGYNDWVVNCTWEGDNNILTLSMGRSLIQSAVAASKGKKLGAASEYLNRYDTLKNARLNGRSLEDPKVLVEAWESASSILLMNAAVAYERELKKANGNVTAAMEKVSQQRYETARVHTRLHLIKSFYNRIAEASKQGTKSETIQILTVVATLFALWSIEQDSGLFLRSRFLAPEDLDNVTALVDEYNAKVREQAIPLTDAFNYSDYFINSPIGNYDGNVYKHYFEKVVRRNPNHTSMAPYFDRLAKPFFFRKDEEQINPTDLE